jgi:glycosyltransferase EpsD
MAHIHSFHEDYIAALRRDGHTVLVMAKGVDADFDIPFEKKMLSPKNTAARRMIRRIVKSEGFDVIYVHTTLAAFHIRLALPLGKRPRVVNMVHGYLFPRPCRTLKDRILLLCERLLRKRTDALILMNDEDVEIAKAHKLAKEPPYFIRGLGAHTPHTETPISVIRRELSLEDKFVMTFVGELSDRKNQRMLISALPLIKPTIPSATLSFVGDGDKREELEQLARSLGVADSVVFAGRRSNPCDFIRASDLYVSASKIEGMPFNIIEALGTGKTVLASDIKGHRDLIKHGESGFLYPVDDMKAFADAVIEIYKGLRPDLDKVLSTYKAYSWDEVFEQTYKVVKEVVEK